MKMAVPYVLRRYIRLHAHSYDGVMTMECAAGEMDEEMAELARGMRRRFGSFWRRKLLSSFCSLPLEDRELFLQGLQDEP